jgi:hypothetical protein
MKILILALCIFLVSCATMKNGSTRPTEGSCMTGYDSAKMGEKESLVGAIMLPVGVLLSFSGPGIMLGGSMLASSRNDDSTVPMVVGGIITGIGALGVIAGIVTLIDGHRRVDNWNNTCVGSTAAERYCLFEPLPPSRGETP